MEGVYNSAERAVLGEGEGASGSWEAGTEEVAGNSWSRSQSVRVLQAVVEIVGNLGEEVGFDGGEGVEENMGVWVELEGAGADIAGRVEVQVHEERKVGVDRGSVVGIGHTVALGDGEEAGELVEGGEVGKAVADVGVAAAANRVDDHHNRSSRTMKTAQWEDAVAGLAEEDSIVNYRYRNPAAGRDCGLRRRTSTKNNPRGAGVEGVDQGGGVVVVDCKMVVAETDFFA